MPKADGSLFSRGVSERGGSDRGTRELAESQGAGSWPPPARCSTGICGCGSSDDPESPGKAAASSQGKKQYRRQRMDCSFTC